MILIFSPLTRTAFPHLHKVPRLHVTQEPRPCLQGPLCLHNDLFFFWSSNIMKHYTKSFKFCTSSLTFHVNCTGYLSLSIFRTKLLEQHSWPPWACATLHHYTPLLCTPKSSLTDQFNMYFQLFAHADVYGVVLTAPLLLSIFPLPLGFSPGMLHHFSNRYLSFILPSPLCPYYITYFKSDSYMLYL